MPATNDGDRATQNTAIKNAIDAMDIDRARQLLRDALQSPDAETYYLASLVALSDEQRNDFLRKALELDPFHAASAAALKKSNTTGVNKQTTGSGWRGTFRAWNSVIRFVAVGIVGVLIILFIITQITNSRAEAEAYTQAAKLLTDFDNSASDWGRIGGDTPFQIHSVSHQHGDFSDYWCVTFTPPLSHLFDDNPQKRNFQVKNAIIEQGNTVWSIYKLAYIAKSNFTEIGCTNWLEEGDISDTQ